MNLKRFTLVYVATALGVIAVVYAVQVLLGHNIANGGMSIIPAIVAAMVEGQRYAKAERAVPESAVLWRFAKAAALMILGLSLIFVVLLSLIMPPLRQMMSDPVGASVLFGGALLQAALGLVLVRFFSGMGAKSQLTAIRKKEGRD
ncbi:ABZJ_00895 family protein [Pseudophaeobacter sp. A-200-2]|uniref:ABZJ_00895 family protein n=1 Tax=Pseudophaeobacter sp. A-200-2 TaxID=3098145 RepID=UPI0034D6FD92